MFLALGLVACADFNPHPELPRETFEAVLLDFYLVDAGITASYPTPEARDSAGRRLYPLVFAKHNVDSATFFYDLDEYFRSPEALKTIHENLLDQVNEILVQREQPGNRSQEVRPPSIPLRRPSLPKR